MDQETKQYIDDSIKNALIEVNGKRLEDKVIFLLLIEETNKNIAKQTEAIDKIIALIKI